MPSRNAAEWLRVAVQDAGGVTLVFGQIKRRIAFRQTQSSSQEELSKPLRHKPLDRVQNIELRGNASDNGQSDHTGECSSATGR